MSELEPKGNSKGLGGLRVAAFESRRAAEMARMLESAGAEAYVSPTMREVPLLENQAVLDFAARLIAGEFDVVIFTTGVGFRLLLRELVGKLTQADFIAALVKVTTIARGPKPVAAMKEAGLSPTIKIPEPNTWRDIVAGFREHVSNVQGARVAVQEYGIPNPELYAALQSLGATITSVPVYQWAMPEDMAPLQANIGRIVAGQIDVALFCSARQAVHLLEAADGMGMEGSLRDALQRVVIGSIGPATTEMLHACNLHVDLEPEHPRLGHLVMEAAAKAGELLQQRRRAGVS